MIFHTLFSSFFDDQQKVMEKVKKRSWHMYIDRGDMEGGKRERENRCGRSEVFIFVAIQFIE